MLFSNENHEVTVWKNDPKKIKEKHRLELIMRDAEITMLSYMTKNWQGSVCKCDITDEMATATVPLQIGWQ
jgi:hypothetical protein